MEFSTIGATPVSIPIFVVEMVSMISSIPLQYYVFEGARLGFHLFVLFLCNNSDLLHGIAGKW